MKKEEKSTITKKMEKPFNSFFYFSIAVGVIFLGVFLLMLFLYSDKTDLLEEKRNSIVEKSKFIEKTKQDLKYTKNIFQSLEESKLKATKWSELIEHVNRIRPKEVFITRYSFSAAGDIVLSMLAESFADAAASIDIFSRENDFENLFSRSVVKAVSQEEEKEIVSFDLSFRYQKSQEEKLENTKEEKEDETTK